MDEEARKLEAEAKKSKVQTNSQEAIMAQFQQVTAIYKTAVVSNNEERAAKYKKMMDLLDDLDGCFMTVNIGSIQGSFCSKEGREKSDFIVF